MIEVMVWFCDGMECLKNVLFDSRMGDKADWGDFFLKHLIDVCKREIEAGNRPQGLWTSTGWKNIVAKFEAKTSDKRTKIQLKCNTPGVTNLLST
jgi:hypothetical protein